MVQVADRHDEQVLLDLLNSTPVADGAQLDLLAEHDAAADWARARGGVGSSAEASYLRHVRGKLQAVVRGAAPPASLASALSGVWMTPEIAESGMAWRLDVDDEDHRLTTRAVLAWGQVQEQMPGRLRPCANDECRLFLLDRSRPNTARWCSMKVCGNRLKARRHYQRTQHTD
ncbi:MAG: CGNR zinc finger domain-containing protein [Pseudonocardiaceae bacterium]